MHYLIINSIIQTYVRFDIHMYYTCQKKTLRINAIISQHSCLFALRFCVIFCAFLLLFDITLSPLSTCISQKVGKVVQIQKRLRCQVKTGHLRRRVFSSRFILFRVEYLIDPQLFLRSRKLHIWPVRNDYGLPHKFWQLTRRYASTQRILTILGEETRQGLSEFRVFQVCNMVVAKKFCHSSNFFVFTAIYTHNSFCNSSQIGTSSIVF